MEVSGRCILRFGTLAFDETARTAFRAASLRVAYGCNLMQPSRIKTPCFCVENTSARSKRNDTWPCVMYHDLVMLKIVVLLRKI